MLPSHPYLSCLRCPVCVFVCVPSLGTLSSSGSTSLYVILLSKSLSNQATNIFSMPGTVLGAKESAGVIPDSAPQHTPVRTSQVKNWPWEELELSYTAGGSAEQCNHFGREFDSFLKSQTCIYHVTSPSAPRSLLTGEK